MADDYALTHKVSFFNNPLKFNPGNPSGNYSQTFTPKPRPSSENKGQNPLYRSQPDCNYCKQIGHLNFECLTLKKKKEGEEVIKPTSLTSLGSKPKSCIMEKNLVSLIGENYAHVTTTNEITPTNETIISFVVKASANLTTNEIIVSFVVDVVSKPNHK